MGRRILLMYISEISGHHSASLAVEKAIKMLNPDAEVMNMNAFNYTNPIWERIINRAYMSVVKNTPELWDYLYDNPKVLKNTRKIREMIHRAHTEKLNMLFDEFKPDTVACTQAYPCGMVADYKKSAGINTPLLGILTDYAPHSYWVYDNVDAYIVPSEETGQKLIRDGVMEDRIKPLGIPIDPKYITRLDPASIKRELNLDPALPVVLIMGGGQGLGPIKKILLTIDRLKTEFQVIVVTGTNKKIYGWIKKRRFKKKIFPFGYIDYIEKLMDASTLIITKPGGVTTAEALAKNLPMLIINPLPGQEMMNTRFLLDEGVALKADEERELAELIDWLFSNTGKLKQIAQKQSLYAKPDAALKVAELLLSL
ncbi:MAG: glycosyltransferase [Candidatus Omnitrophica bacterium]|nr:glycosyltransferase [Candidatus Omnitrophota bacterium]